MGEGEERSGKIWVRCGEKDVGVRGGGSLQDGSGRVYGGQGFLCEGVWDDAGEIATGLVLKNCDCFTVVPAWPSVIALVQVGYWTRLRRRSISLYRSFIEHHGRCTLFASCQPIRGVGPGRKFVGKRAFGTRKVEECWTGIAVPVQD
jgi:hypothetical protein